MEFVKTKFDQLFTRDSVGKPMTPGYWKSKEMTYMPITRLTMTSGGGLGGSRWNEYVKRVKLEDLTEGTRVVFETWDGEEKLINLNNVVEAEYYTIAYGVYHSDNSNYKTGDYTYYYLVKDGHKIKIKDNDFDNYA